MYHKDILYLLFVQISAIFVIEDCVGQYIIKCFSVKTMQNGCLESKRCMLPGKTKTHAFTAVLDAVL